MTLPPSKKSNIWKILAIALLVVVIIMGAIVGVLSINRPSANQGDSNHGFPPVNNQVQVSGTIQEQSPTEIFFVSLDRTVTTSAIITNSQYSVVLVGNMSYGIEVTYTNIDGYSESTTYSLYVPSGVTTFTANF